MEKSTLGVAVRSEGGVAGEGRIVGVPKFLFLHGLSSPSTQIGCPHLCINLYYIILCGSFPMVYLKVDNKHRI